MTKYYLITANIVLVIFAIWFANVGLLPFKNPGDFALFAVLGLILGLYRPGWTFLFFVGTLALENINLAPKGFGLALRPYQLFGFVTIIALLVQIAIKRIVFALPKFHWYDSLLLLFALAGFLSALGTANKGVSLKQSVIALSFVALYFLVRVFVQSFDDLKRIAPFFLSSGLVVAAYSIWQNIRFLAGSNSFEVMPGRPNGTFTEPDWLGIYLVFLLSVIMTIIFYQSKKTKISKQLEIFKKIGIYFFAIITLVSLILTVSRSAWVGAFFVVLVFLKSTLLNNYVEVGEGASNKWKRFVNILKMQNWQWKKAGLQLVYILLAIGASLAAAMPLTRFQLNNRAASTGGLQKITIACPAEIDFVPAQNIKTLDDIKPCRHINLEDIEKEKAFGNTVMEVNRPDPNVNIRAEIYQKSIAQIKAHPIFGLGWGGISSVLGNDERGAGLNASNIFLEVWLGSGLLGIVSFVILLGYILVASIGLFLGNDKYKNGTALVFVLAGWAAVVLPNLFNSGIFLGFIWVYLGVAVGLLAKKNS